MNEEVRRRVLLVEDHAPLLGVMASCLRQAGYDVLTAVSAERALLELSELVPDVIVTDVMMPGLDGFRFAERVRRSARIDLVPIIFLTARDARTDRIRGMKAGIDAYLTKPFEADELVATIENVLGRVRRVHRRVAQMTVAVPLAEGSEDDAQGLEYDAMHDEVSGRHGAADGRRDISSRRDSALTETEQKVGSLLTQSLTNKEIASTLGISYRTVEMHISNMLAKMHLANRVELALTIAREQPSGRTKS